MWAQAQADTFAHAQVGFELKVVLQLLLSGSSRRGGKGALLQNAMQLLPSRSWMQV